MISQEAVSRNAYSDSPAGSKEPHPVGEDLDEAGGSGKLAQWAYRNPTFRNWTFVLCWEGTICPAGATELQWTSQEAVSRNAYSDSSDGCLSVILGPRGRKRTSPHGCFGFDEKLGRELLPRRAIRNFTTRARTFEKEWGWNCWPGGRKETSPHG